MTDRYKYRIHNMHGPTVYADDSIEPLRRIAARASVNAGPYRIVMTHDGHEVERYDDGRQVSTRA